MHACPHPQARVYICIFKKVSTWLTENQQISWYNTFSIFNESPSHNSEGIIQKESWLKDSKGIKESLLQVEPGIKKKPFRCSNQRSYLCHVIR